MDTTEITPASTPRRRRMALAAALGIAVLMLAGIMAAALAVLWPQALARAEAERPVAPDRVQVVSAVWKKTDQFEIRVRLSRADGAPLRGLHGVRLIDPNSDGYGTLSDYPAARMAAPDGTLAVAEVVALQGMIHPPKGPLTLQIQGWTGIPRSDRSPIERFLFGPDLPRVPALRYPLTGGTVILPAPPGNATRKTAAD